MAFRYIIYDPMTDMIVEAGLRAAGYLLRREGQWVTVINADGELIKKLKTIVDNYD